jgi:DNA-binding transcriptional regulator YdaS (Cro superfamily)
MITFCKLLEAMENPHRSPLMDSGEESKGLSVIRTGQSMHGEDADGSFWEDFISLCGDTEGMAELLGVRPEQVNSWPSKIREAIQSVEKHDMQGENKPEEKQQMLPTGQNGAMTTQKMNQSAQNGYNTM